MQTISVSKGNLTPQEAENTPLPFDKFNMWFESFELKRPQRPAAVDEQQNIFEKNDNNMYPSECRLRGINYSAQLLATVCR
jgi:DNA-directed RNA polymerase beta subunit